MGYAPPILKNDYVSVSTHNRSGIAPGHCFAVEDAVTPKIDTLTFFDTSSIDIIRNVLSSLVNLDVTKPIDGQGSLVLFHSINPEDPVNLTNSKLPSMHFHVISGELGEGFEHIQTQKTYVPNPNSQGVQSFVKALEPLSEFQTVTQLPNDVREAKSHGLIIHKGFSGLSNFAEEATHAEVGAFAGILADMIVPYLEDGVGGSRIVIDERYTHTGVFTVHVLGGEYLGQEPDKKHRWFDKPAP